MKVLVTGRLPKEVLERITGEHEVEANPGDRPMDRGDMLKRIADKEGLLCMITDRVDQELLDHAPRLKMIANYGVGYNNIDVGAVSGKGIPVSNTPEVLTEATADLAFALILGVARRLVEGDRMTREGGFQFWAPLYFLGSEVSGKTLGIVGFGRIGRAVARRAKGFDMRVLYFDAYRPDPSIEQDLGAAYAPMKTLLSESDFVSLHVPLTDQTHHLIDAEALGLMKPEAYLVNTSRGPVIDETALLTALEDKRIAGAGLDVYEKEPQLTPGLKDMANVILLPHVGSATWETRTKMAEVAAMNLLAGLRGEIPPNCVNREALNP